MTKYTETHIHLENTLLNPKTLFNNLGTLPQDLRIARISFQTAGTVTEKASFLVLKYCLVFLVYFSYEIFCIL